MQNSKITKNPYQPAAPCQGVSSHLLGISTVAAVAGGVFLTRNPNLFRPLCRTFSSPPASNLIPRAFGIAALSSFPVLPIEKSKVLCQEETKTGRPSLQQKITAPADALKPKTLFERYASSPPPSRDLKKRPTLHLTLEETDPIKNEVTDKMVGQQADYLVSGTNLEGFHIQLSAEHLSTFTQRCKEQEIISPKTASRLEKVLEDLKSTRSELRQKTEERKASAQKLADTVRNLGAGESFDMQGGWVKKEGDSLAGHALIYRFQKRDDGFYNVYIYNTGDGINKYHQHITAKEGTKQKTLYCPYIKYQKVEPERLGIGEDIAYPEFFERLLEIAQGVHPFKSSEILYENRDVFGALNDKIAESRKDSCITAQRSGTCAYRSVLARLREEFESEEEYKIYNFILKYTDFIIFSKVKSSDNSSILGSTYSFVFSEDPSSLTTPSDIKLLIERVGKKLLLSLIKRSDLFSEEEIQRAKDKINSILEYISTLQEITPLTSDSKAFIRDRTSIDKAGLRSLPVSDIIPTVTTNLGYHEDIVVTPLTLANLERNLIQIQKTPESQVRLYATEKLARELLEFSKEDIAKIPESKVKSITANIHSVLNDYIHTNPREFLRSPTARNTTWALVAISYELTSRIVPDLQDYEISHQILLNDAKNELYIEYSKAEMDCLKKIITRLEKKKPPIFNFATYPEIREESPPPELDWLERKFPWNRPFVSFADRLNLLIKEDQLTGEEGQAIIKLRDIVYYANLSCSSSYYYNSNSFQNVHNSFSVQEEKGRPPCIAPRFYQRHTSSRREDIWGKSHHSHSTFGTEGEVLIDPQGFAIKDIAPSIFCNKAMRCSKLIYYFSTNYIKLKDPETQKKFFQLLFQSGAPGKLDTTIAPIFENVKDLAFMHQLTQFIEGGTRFFLDNRLTGKSDLISTLFFARLSRRIQEIDPITPLPSFEEGLNDYLAMPDLGTEEKKLIHLHRILQYKGVSPETLSKKQLQEIAVSWILCKDSIFTEKGDGRVQKEEAFRFIRFLTPQLQSFSKEELNEILAKALNQPIKDASTTSSINWSVNLVSGQVFKNGKLQELSATEDLKVYPIYTELFGDVDFDQIKEGNSYEFTDPKTGNRFRGIKKPWTPNEHPNDSCTFQMSPIQV